MGVDSVGKRTIGIKIGTIVWEVDSVRLCNNRGVIKAEVDMRMWFNSEYSMMVRYFKVMQNDNSVWVKPPQIIYKNKKHEERFEDVVRFEENRKPSSETWCNLSEVILEAYNEAMEHDISKSKKVVVKLDEEIECDDGRVYISENSWLNKIL